MMPEEDTSNNALGLDFAEKPDKSDSQTPQEPSPDLKTVKKEKEKPYVNPERVKTGGAQRDKLSDEALQERMTRIREQNERIKQRRLDVQADEEAFRKTQEAERAKQIQNRKIQAEIDRTRDQNAKRKMDKVQNREWDSGKGSEAREHRGPHSKKADSYNRPQSTSNHPASKQSNFAKPTPTKSASSTNALSIKEPSVDAPSVIPDEPPSNEPIPAPEIPQLPVPATVFSPDQETDYSAWFTPGETTVPKEAFVDPFSSAAQEKSDYSEWFTGDSTSNTTQKKSDYSEWFTGDSTSNTTQKKSDYSEWFTGDNTSNATQNYSDWSIPDQSASPTETQTGSYRSSNSRGERGKGRGSRGSRGRGRGEGGRGSSAPRRGNEKEAPKPS